MRDADSELPHPQDVGGALRHADAVARIENVEQMGAPQAVFERGPEEARRKKGFGQLVVAVEQLAMNRGERRRRQAHADAEDVARLLDLVPQPDIAILHATRPLEIVDVVDALQDHRQTFEAIREFGRNGRQLDATGLLKVRELRNLEAVEENLPTNPPGADCRRLPVVVLEANVVLPEVDPACVEAIQIELLHIIGSGFEHNLKLVMLEQAVGIFAEASVGRIFDHLGRWFLLLVFLPYDAAVAVGPRLTALHVMVYSMDEEAPEMYETLLSDSRLGLADLRRRFEAYSRERLAAAVGDVVGAPSTVETTLAVGKPYHEILRIAAEQHADLIVMGAHGRGPVDVMFFGSTTNHVVRQAHCPVLTVRK